MDRDMNQWVPQKGMNVMGSEGDKVGEVDVVEPDYFVVRKGFFFPEDHYVPISAVSTYDDNNVYLNLTREQALEERWTTPPEGNIDPATTGNYNRADAVQTDTTAQPGYDPNLAAADTGRDETVIPIHEEELVAKRRDVDRGDVSVDKDVVEEQQSIDVPVTEEHVNVTRRDVDRDVAPGEEAFKEEEIDVPVRGEEVDVSKRTRVTGEVDIDKTAEQHTERVQDTVRREEVTVEGDEVDNESRNKKSGR